MALNTTTLVASLQKQTTTPREHDGDAFAVEVYLTELATELRDLSDKDVYRLDRLCKKVDVVKRLRAFYSPNLARLRGKVDIDGSFVSLFAGVLLHYALQRRDPKFLNSALKIVDGIRPAAAHPPELQRAADVLVRGWFDLSEEDSARG